MIDVNTEKIIQTVVNGVSSLRLEMQNGFIAVGKRINDLEARLDKRIDGVEERIDKIGRQAAFPEEYAPIRAEFERPDKKVNQHIPQYSHSPGSAN